MVNLDILRTIGRVVEVIGWIACAYVLVTWYIYPALSSFTQFYKWILSSQGIQSTLISFIPIIVVIWFGSHIQRLSIEKRMHQQDQIIGFPKSHGRLSLSELAARMGVTVSEIERELATIRTRRDIIFTINDGYVNLPGSEMGRPVKEVERITREIVTTQCKYCGGTIPLNSVKCPNYGANLQ